jgi:tetratricopeptide (TPR) repeat protein
MPARRAIVLALVLAAANFASGCRILRGPRISDESIAAARRLSLQGIDAQQRGHWDRSETLFAAAILKCPSDERARWGYAEALWRRGAFDQAIGHMEEAVRLSGHDPERLVRLGHMYRARGDWQRAGELAERAIAANSQLAAAWALRGDVLRSQGQRSEALAAYHRALSYAQPLPEVQLAIADIYAQDNRPQRALTTLQALAGSYPPGQAPPEVLFRQALVFRTLSRHHDSIRTFRDLALRGDPPPELLSELARSQMLTADATAARQTILAALNSYPHDSACLALANELHMSTGQVAPALAIGPRAERR